MEKNCNKAYVAGKFNELETMLVATQACGAMAGKDLISCIGDAHESGAITYKSFLSYLMMRTEVQEQTGVLFDKFVVLELSDAVNDIMKATFKAVWHTSNNDIKDYILYGTFNTKTRMWSLKETNYETE